MATSLSRIECSCAVGATLGDTVEGQARSQPGSLAAALSLTSGTSANQADRWIQDKDRVLTAGTSEDLDIFDLAGFDSTTDLLGNTVTFTSIVALYVFSHSTSAGELHVGGNGTSAAWSTPFNDDDSAVNVVHPGGVMLLATPDVAYLVADALSHLLRMAAVGGNVTYDIGLLGRSA